MTKAELRQVIAVTTCVDSEHRLELSGSGSDSVLACHERKLVTWSTRTESFEPADRHRIIRGHNFRKFQVARGVTPSALREWQKGFGGGIIQAPSVCSAARHCSPARWLPSAPGVQSVYTLESRI
ncbi:hypothetical protein M758_6G155800 [Ceratodon purpureus]|nr:hypothetical protein M758_6G155800 [Ceratodon purpureus]